MKTLTITNGTCDIIIQEGFNFELENGEYLKIIYDNLSLEDKVIYDDFFNLCGDNIFFEIKNLNRANIIDRFTNKIFTSNYDFLDFNNTNCYKLWNEYCNNTNPNSIVRKLLNDPTIRHIMRNEVSSICAFDANKKNGITI